jgi:hypothetical protein
MIWEFVSSCDICVYILKQPVLYPLYIEYNNTYIMHIRNVSAYIKHSFSVYTQTEYHADRNVKFQGRDSYICIYLFTYLTLYIPILLYLTLFAVYWLPKWHECLKHAYMYKCICVCDITIV